MLKAALHNPHLEGGSFSWRAGPTGILLIHGFTATTTEVRLLAHRLFLEGYSVSGPLLPGHGTTPTALNRCRWQDWAEEIEAAYSELSGYCDQIIVGGESMGAVLACWLASTHHEAAGLLLYSPAISVPSLRKGALLSWIIPFANKKTGRDRLPWQGYTVWPLHAARQFYILQQVVAHRLDQISQPTLIIQGKLDRTIHPDCGNVIYNQITSRVKEFVWMKQSSHCVLLDGELDEITKRTVRFIRDTGKNQGKTIPAIRFTPDTGRRG